MEDTNRFDSVDQEQLAAQVVAVMDSHFQRPTADQKRRILRLAEAQIRAADHASRQTEAPQQFETAP
jgi:hypothetical protein